MDGLTQPVCIAGMHRSGTSLVTNLLRLCGLYLGHEQDLIEIKVGNADGHWENRKFVAVNDAVLARLGGWWAEPPATMSDNQLSHLAAEKDLAARLLHEFEGCEWWGWKDPRNCLTLPFWLDFFPAMKTIVCLRHPLEVVRSLERRGDALVRYSWPRMASSQTGMKLWRLLDRSLGTLGGKRERRFFPSQHWLMLWKTYNQRILEFTRPEQRLVTHYDSYFTNPRAELSRVLNFLGVVCSDEIIEQSCAVVSTRLRNEQHSEQDLDDAEVSNLYKSLCEEASGYSRN